MPVSCPPRPALLGSLGLSLLLLGGCSPGALPDDDRDQARQGQAAEVGYVQGQYEARMATMLDGTSRLSHHVKTPEGVFELAVDGLAFEPLEYDTYVRVPGDLASDGRWQADDLIVLSPPPQPLMDPEFRDPRRIGTVLVHWDGNGLPNGEANNRMYLAPDSTNVYYGENSYGIETMSGKVFGSYVVNDPGGCNVDLIVNLAEEAMIDKGHDPTQFRQMMFYFPNGTGCGFAGLASIGSPNNPARNSWYHGSFGCTTRNQELGHNYGMGHSHAYSCPATPPGMDHNLYEDCEHIEYGHPYDPMGDGCGHMNVVQKTYMGWLEGCNVVTATSDGIFNLLPTELPCDGTQALRFPAYDGRYYYLEYRNGDGEFAIGSGVLVNVAPELGLFGPPNYVLDELGANTNGYLHEGDSFTDPGSPTTFTILEEYDTHVVIQVSMENGGDGQPPSCYDGAGDPVMEAGAIGTLACAAEPYPGDDTPPEVTITYPNDGDQFEAGASFTITADASDDRQLIEVALHLAESIDELSVVPFDVKTEPPWEWEATNTPAGSYVFAVVARDARNLAQSQIVSIQVGGDDPGGLDSGGTDEDTGEPPPPPMGTGTGDASDTDTDTDGLDGGATDPPPGCECGQGERRGGGAGFALLLLGLGWLRRRRLA